MENQKQKIVISILSIIIVALIATIIAILIYKIAINKPVNDETINDDSKLIENKSNEKKSNNDLTKKENSTSNNEIKKINNTNNNTNNNDKIINSNQEQQSIENKEQDLNLNEVLNYLNNELQTDKNMTTIIVKCEEIEDETSYLPDINNEISEVSNNTINMVIDKLKLADSIDNNITYSFFGCPPKSIEYYMTIKTDNASQAHQNSILSLNYANDNNILLVGYNKKGYAFKYKNSAEIDNFIETLK